MFSNHNTLAICFLIFLGFLSVASARDPFQQPFHQNSIWNMPIGSVAEYVHAKIQPATAYGMTVDEDLIVLTPEAPPVEIFISNAGWDSNKDRCQIDGGLMFEAPIPEDYIISPDTWDGSTPNSGLAVLMDDWRTIKQTQPFARCYEGENGTSRYTFGDEDLYGNGYYGAHGATKLSAIGGTLRVGELVPGVGPIRHALKVNIFAAKNVYYDSQTKGYRWPAKSADGYAAGTYGTQGDPVIDCRMGALLALPATMNLDDLNLETEPARLLAQAFQDYGAYLVDDTAWDVYAIITEWSPRGRVKDEFEQAWGFSMSTNSQSTSWAKDMRKIFTNLHVVVNNTAASIGGGGTPRVPLAEPIAPNRPPLVRLQVSSTSGEPPLTVEFDASQTTDPENDPISFSWDFGDGNSTTGAVVSHTFIQTGIYSVTLFLDDGFPLSKYVKKTVTVQVGAIEKMEGTGMGTPGSRNNRGNTFEKAFDQDMATYFEGPNADSSWAGMDFGSGVNVITIAYAARSGSESRMVDGKFQGANAADFSDAVTIYTIEAKPEPGKMNKVIVNDHGTYRYARYIGAARSYCVIAELAFYGTTVTNVKDASPAPAVDFRLEQNYPNPFNPQTTIRYDLSESSEVTLVIYDMQGRVVRSLVNSNKSGGAHQVIWDGRSDAGFAAASGLYLCRMDAGEFSQVRKVTFIK